MEDYMEKIISDVLDKLEDNSYELTEPSPIFKRIDVTK